MKIWAAICETLGKHDWAPNQQDSLEWLCRKMVSATRQRRTCTQSSACIFGIVEALECHYFDGAVPMIRHIMDIVMFEGRVWALVELLRGTSIISMVD